VADLAASIFDAIVSEHGLTPRHRLLLRAAAVLHEIGGFVSSRAHHKHSGYLISNSELFGLRREELMTVALVARYHRRSVPMPTHVEYMSLPREQRIVVSKLSAILRVADCLDRGRAQQARDLRFERSGGDLVIYVRGAGDLNLERRALDLKADLFQDIYGLRVRLEEAR
jgi:exopolyphosphatase/guanosine-5'-triphosphate,3'-diphosphate pyrophosphatase